MSINNLTDAELLKIAQSTRELEQKVYDSGKSSVWNYNKIHAFKISFQDELPFRVPLDLAHQHYTDWLQDKYPHILPHDLQSFSKEIIGYVHHTKIKNIYYLLIRNCAQFRKYKEHTFNQFLKERSRKRYNRWQKRNR